MLRIGRKPKAQLLELQVPEYFEVLKGGEENVKSLEPLETCQGGGDLEARVPPDIERLEGRKEWKFQAPLDVQFS